MIKTYDPKEMSIIIGTRPITGFEDGSYIKIKRNADMYTTKVGADGKPIRSKSNNMSGEIEITLQQGADDNDYLSALAASDELTNGGVRPFVCKDNLGTSLYASESVWVKKQPDVDFAKEVGGRTWVFSAGVLAMFTGKNNDQ